MGHSFIDFRGKYIRSKDYKIETWLRLMAQEIDSLAASPVWLRDARDFWIDHARSYANGCMDPELDRLIKNNEQLNALLTLCKSVQSKLQSFGQAIPKEFLNELCELKPPSHILEDNDPELYLEYVRALIQLLEGWQTNDTEHG
ncbi:hypothetical protein I5L51_17855 [Pseudomonas mendocina]|nr:hypothetical protein [Pseudomonas mendocina]MBH3340979.1 hypothetical protein [Pseudomonas mendocina]